MSCLEVHLSTALHSRGTNPSSISKKPTSKQIHKLLKSDETFRGPVAWHTSELTPSLPQSHSMPAPRIVTPIPQTTTLPTEFFCRSIHAGSFLTLPHALCLSVLRLALKPFHSGSWNFLGFSSSPDNPSCLQKGAQKWAHIRQEGRAVATHTLVLFCSCH